MLIAPIRLPSIVALPDLDDSIIEYSSTGFLIGGSLFFFPEAEKERCDLISLHLSGSARGGISPSFIASNALKMSISPTSFFLLKLNLDPRSLSELDRTMIRVLDEDLFNLSCDAILFCLKHVPSTEKREYILFFFFSSINGEYL